MKQSLYLSATLSLLAIGGLGLITDNHQIRNLGATLFVLGSGAGVGGALLRMETEQVNKEKSDKHRILVKSLNSKIEELTVKANKPPEIKTLTLPAEVRTETIEKIVNVRVPEPLNIALETENEALKLKTRTLEGENSKLKTHCLLFDTMKLEKRLAIEELEALKAERQTSLEQLVRQFTAQMGQNLSQATEENLESLRETVEAYLERLGETHPVAQSLTKLLTTIKEKKAIYSEIISQLSPDYENPLADLNEFVGIFTQLSTESQSLRTRFRNSLNVCERLEVRNKISRDYAVKQLEQLAREQDEFKLCQEACQQEIETLLSTIEQKLAQIDSLKAELAEAKKSKPVEWALAVRDDMRLGNLIIRYFLQQGIWLDRGYAEYSGYESRLTFHTDRNNQPVLVKSLNEHSEQLQDLLNTLNAPTFKRDETTGLFETTIQISPKPKTVVTTQTELEIEKLWVRASKFPDLVKGFNRVRITGGSESGKSPTAENLAVCLLQGMPVGNKVKLFNPQFDSQKNYWTVPTVGKCHSDSVRGVKALAAEVKARSEGSGDTSREVFELCIFDEIDSTFSSTRSPKEVADNVNYIIKQASHQNLGAIFIGQNANVSEYPGMSRSDWNSAVNIHIGANAFDAISNSNRFKGKAQQVLLDTAERLTQYCEMKNTQLGLDKTNPKAYRFALVVEPSKQPYFIELPEFGLYQYQDTSETSQLLTNKTNDLSEITCPSCGTNKVAKHSIVVNKTRYKCLNKDCDRKTFTVTN